MGTGIKFIDNFLNITLEKKKTLNEFRVFCINKKNTITDILVEPLLFIKKRRDFSPFVNIKTKLSLAQHFSDENLQLFWIGFPLGLLHCLTDQEPNYTCLS